MPKRFGPQHIKNGYAAMGGNKRRPIYKGTTTRTVAESIAAARRTAQREAAARSSKKGK